MRINKYLAQCGVASRRDCDKLVADGRVTVNGRPADVGADVEEGDVIKVDGKVVTVKKTNTIFCTNRRVISAPCRTIKAEKLLWISLAAA